jgi:kynurenine formamidase
MAWRSWNGVTAPARDARPVQDVELVGHDYLSVAHADEQVPVHRVFLDHGVVLLEGIDLSEIVPRRYELMLSAPAPPSPRRAVPGRAAGPR